MVVVVVVVVVVFVCCRERTLEAERDRHRKEMKEKDDEIAHLRHMVRQQYTLSLPSNTMAPGSTTGATAKALATTDEGNNDMAETNVVPSLWARRKSLAHIDQRPPLLRVINQPSTAATTATTAMTAMTATTANGTTTANSTTTNGTTTTTTALPQSLTIVTKASPDTSPSKDKQSMKKTARNSMKHLRLDYVDEEEDCSPTTSFTSSSSNAGGPPKLNIDDEESFSGDFRTTSGSTFTFHDPHDPHGTASAASAAASSNSTDPNWNKTLDHKSTAMFGQNLLKTRGFEIDAFGIVSTPRGAFKRDESQRGSSR